MTNELEVLQSIHQQLDVLPYLLAVVSLLFGAVIAMAFSFGRGVFIFFLLLSLSSAVIAEDIPPLVVSGIDTVLSSSGADDTYPYSHESYSYHAYGNGICIIYHPNSTFGYTIYSQHLQCTINGSSFSGFWAESHSDTPVNCNYTVTRAWDGAAWQSISGPVLSSPVSLPSDSSATNFCAWTTQDVYNVVTSLSNINVAVYLSDGRSLSQLAQSIHNDMNLYSSNSPPRTIADINSDILKQLKDLTLCCKSNNSAIVTGVPYPTNTLTWDPSPSDTAFSSNAPTQYDNQDFFNSLNDSQNRLTEYNDSLSQTFSEADYSFQTIDGAVGSFHFDFIDLLHFPEPLNLPQKSTVSILLPRWSPDGTIDTQYKEIDFSEYGSYVSVFRSMMVVLISIWSVSAAIWLTSHTLS